MATVDLTMSDSDVSVCGVPGSGAAPVEIVESEDEPLDQKKTKRVKYEGEMGAAAAADAGDDDEMSDIELMDGPGRSGPTHRAADDDV